jgi:hypothetical protein
MAKVWGEAEMEAQTDEAKRAEAAIYLFTECVHNLESHGWIRQPQEAGNPWYWWRNSAVATGLCSIGAALRYEHARQNRERPLILDGYEEQPQ